VVWGHVQATQYLDNPFLAAVKVGAFGSVGWHATSTLTSTSGTDVTPVPGTASNHKQYLRYGGEAHLYFLSTVNPLTLSAVIWGGKDDKALIDGGAATDDASFIGGFLEGVWTVTPRLSLIGRYEMIHPSQTTIATPVVGDFNAWTATIRHTFELTSRTEAAIHLEFSRASQDAGDGTSPANYAALIGLDFAL
jgi:hypothetical protein